MGKRFGCRSRESSRILILCVLLFLWNLICILYMPQFDTMTFFNQVFWLITIVFVFYTVVARYVLPVLAFSLKSRAKNLKLTTTPK